MKAIKKILLGITTLLTVVGYADPIKVVTSTTDLAWAVNKIGGPHVEVKALLKGTENPHYVDAVPEFIRLAAEAQMVAVIGLDLEIGWVPKVLARSGNAQVQPGGRGYVEVGKVIAVLEKPTGAVDRSMGDIHPAGNPHFWLSPKVFAQAAKPIADTLIELDPSHAADYQKNLAKLTDELLTMQKENEKKLHPLVAAIKGPALLEYHKEFAYFLEAYGLKSLGSIEEKPGVAPSAGRLAEVAMQAKNAGVKCALAADTAPKKTLQRFSELSGLPIVTVPMSIQPNGQFKDYEALQAELVGQVARGLQGIRG